jgi:glucose-6-phosphate 1-dehydrogenase
MSSSKTDIVLFGARGDLSRRKLFPALYQLDKADLLSDDTRIAGVARQDLETADFVEKMGETLKTNLGDDWDEKIWSRF